MSIPVCPCGMPANFNGKVWYCHVAKEAAITTNKDGAPCTTHDLMIAAKRGAGKEQP